MSNLSPGTSQCLMESSTSGGIRQAGHFNYVKNSGRSGGRLTLVSYDSRKQTFKALQLRNACDMKMGIRRKDGHYFFVEEVVWMVEAGLAAVLHNGAQLSIQQCYWLLSTFLITPARFFTYSYLKRAGYVILPHNALQTSTQSEAESHFKEQSPKSYFPSDLLDQFPNYHSANLKMPSLHNNSKLVEVFGLSEEFLKLNDKSFKLNQQTDILERQPKEMLRPRYWPRFDRFTSHVPTWSDYRFEKVKILSDRNNHPSKRISESLMSSPIDYDVYAGDGSFSRNASPKPLYRILVLDLSMPFPSASTLHWLSSQSPESKLLLAIFQHASVIFYNIDHQAVYL